MHHALAEFLAKWFTVRHISVIRHLSRSADLPLASACASSKCLCSVGKVDLANSAAGSFVFLASFLEFADVVLVVLHHCLGKLAVKLCARELRNELQVSTRC